MKNRIKNAINELMITSGTQIFKNFIKCTITHVFSASQRAITLQAAQIGEPAQPIDVHELSHHARAVNADQVTIHESAKLWSVLTIAIL